MCAVLVKHLRLAPRDAENNSVFIRLPSGQLHMAGEPEMPEQQIQISRATHLDRKVMDFFTQAYKHKVSITERDFAVLLK